MCEDVLTTIYSLALAFMKATCTYTCIHSHRKTNKQAFR